MGSWRNRLAQDSYTIKVNGSSPLLPTIKKKFIIIDYGIATGLIPLWLMIMEIVNA